MASALMALNCLTRDHQICGRFGFKDALGNGLHFMCILTHSKVCLNRRQSGETRKLTSLGGRPGQQAYRAYACILPYDVSFL